MDYSKFMDSNFDAKEWVNAAFNSMKESGSTKDQYATTLVMKLQMFIQEVNNILEDASQQAFQNLPRVMREIDAVKQEASLLQDQMRTVKQDIQNVEQSTAQSMQGLLSLDRVKSRMQMTADALKEADNWTTLSADVEEVFQSSNVQAITDKVRGMQQSLQMLVDTPDYAERCSHLEKLKNRLEAVLSPQLVAAFNSHSIEAAQAFNKMFRDIQRLPQLYKYYHKCHKNQLLQQWRDITQTKAEEGVANWITELYDLLLTTWHSQIKWCNQVFEDSVPVVCDLLSETLSSLDPPLGAIISSSLSRSSDTLGSLIEIKQVSERFAKSIEGSVEAYMTDSVEHQASLEHLLSAVYQPYRPHVTRYKTYEEVALASALTAIPLDSQEVPDTVQLLAESVVKLFAAASQASARCQSLTAGFGFVGLVEALHTYFSSYSREARRVLGNIREKCRTAAGEGSDMEDWDGFQNSLRFIQTCGDLLMHLEELDTSLITAVLHSLAPLLASSTSPAKDGDKRSGYQRQGFDFRAALYLSQKEEVEALRSLVSKLEAGDMPSVLPEARADLVKLCVDVHKFSFDIVFAPLRRYLGDVAALEIWTSRSAGGALTSDLPVFSLAPQEYITKIGQYLLTLPQHLEPFTLQDNPQLVTAVRHGKLPFMEALPAHPDHLADLWLEAGARGAMHLYSEEILKIADLTPHATKQLVTDIDYLTNVLDDLGLATSDTLKNIEALLRAGPEEMADLAEQMPQRIFHAISGMRRMEP